MGEAALAVMAKLPAAGQTKSRLSRALGAANAAILYEAMLLDTIELAVRLEGAQLAVAVTPPDAVDHFQYITPPGTTLLPVAGADIGDCLNQTLTRLLAAGYGAAFALNSDGPTLPIAYLRRALTELEDLRIDVVLGPSEDGGYYLVGLKRPRPALFQDISWSTDRVTAQTLAKAEVLGLNVARLPPWYDIDTPDDLDRLRAELPKLPADALSHTRPLLEGSAPFRHDESLRFG